ncbi:AAA family ATPase, partial [Alienimonas sp. DA493]|uniref:AAA family ATPase n=1 Tax=Alienimonas sp. DA493 TaxID=3373605 RepID=UPI003754E131
MSRPRSAPQDEPPHDRSAEQAILATFMQDPDSLDDPRCKLTEEDFSSDRNKLIYCAVRALHARGGAVDLVTVADEMARAQTLADAGGLFYLDEVVASVPNLGRGPDYAAIVRRYALKRHLRWRLGELSNAGADDADLVTEAAAAVKAQFPPLESGGDWGGLVVRTLADVTPSFVEWLWEERIALGKITLFAGLPGLGKSFLTVDLAARTSVSRPWPDGRGAPPPGDVVILNAEDDAGDTIRPRLDAAGGDPKRVHVLEAVRGPDGKERGFDLAADLDRLRTMLRKLPAPKLVIVDPVNAYLGRADSHKEADVRGVLEPLRRLAEEFGVAVVLVSHLNKGSGAGAMGRVTGSLAFVGAARAAWLISDDPA